MTNTKERVILLRHTYDPEEVVAMAARLCYNHSDLNTLSKKIQKSDIEGFIKKLIDMGHMSPIEHASFTFAIEGISMECSHQLIRHRMASYNQQSRRCQIKGDIEEDFFYEYVTPPLISEDREAEQLYKEFMSHAMKTYNKLLKRLENMGFNNETADKNAHYVMPNAVQTRIMVTMNARELLHFFHQRCCNRSDWEIHSLADEMLRQCKKVAPTIFTLAGPGCLIGSCPEGDLTCGTIKEVRKKYEILQ